MTKYKVGGRVRVVREKYGHEFDIGSIVTIIYVNRKDERIPYKCIDENDDIWWLSESEITPASKPAPEITVNGAVYILKPEPKHVWKFGDWARNENGSLGMVISYEHTDGGVWFLRKGDTHGSFVSAARLTYISSAEIPA